MEDKVSFSQRTANQFMRIAKEFGSNSQVISNLEITKVGLLLDVPIEKREEFIENYDLKSMSTREIKKVIKETINEKPKLGESVVDKRLDESIYEIPIKELSPIPDYEQYFGMRTGTDWIMFLNNWYISQFWLDTLFDTNYGDKSGDITHYLTDERLNVIKHNQMIMNKMYDVVRDKINGKITENEMDEKISELHKQYKNE